MEVWVVHLPISFSTWGLWLLPCFPASPLPHSGHIATTSQSLPFAALGVDLVSEIMNLSLGAAVHRLLTCETHRQGDSQALSADLGY